MCSFQKVSAKTKATQNWESFLKKSWKLRSSKEYNPVPIVDWHQTRNIYLLSYLIFLQHQKCV